METTTPRACQSLSLAPRRLRFECEAQAIFDVLERLSSLARRSSLLLCDLVIERCESLAIVDLSVAEAGAPSALADPEVASATDVFVARLEQLVEVGNLQWPSSAPQRMAA